MTTPPPTDSRSAREYSTAERTQRFVSEALPLRTELERAARRYTHNVHDAEDLVSETYVKAWSGFASFEAGTNLRAWMFRIMANTWIDAHRKAQRRPQEALAESFSDTQLKADGQRRGTGPSAEAHALQRLPDETLRTALQALPPTLQAVVYYVDICQLSYKEIAAIAGIPLGTVMSRVHRAHRQLRIDLCQNTELHHSHQCGPQPLAA